MNLSLISKILRKYPVLVVCILIVPLSLLITSMRAPKIQFYKDEQAKLAKRWGDIQTNLNRSRSLKEDSSKIEQGISRIQSRLMNVDQVASNYDFFYSLERQSGVKFDQFSLGTPTNGSGLNLGEDKLNHFSAVPCRVVMSGSINSILTFMDLLDRQKFLVKMDLLNVAKYSTNKQISDDSDVLTAQLRCHVLASNNE